MYEAAWARAVDSEAGSPRTSSRTNPIGSTTLAPGARVRSASIVPAKPPVPCTMKGTTVDRGPAGGHLVFLPITHAVISKQRFVRWKNQKLTRATGFFRETFSERCEAAAKEAGKGARTGGTKG